MHFQQLPPRLVFPLFNSLVGAVFGALTGYYVAQLAAGLLLGALGGLLVGGLVELLFSRLTPAHALYRRRVLLTVLLEIPLAVMLVGPYVFTLRTLAPTQHTVCCQTPLDYGAVTYEDIRITAPDGVALVGWYIPPVHQPGAVVVVLHGSHSDRRGAAWHAAQLIQAGYGVLMYDQRACGESGGANSSLGWLESTDLLAALDWLAARPEVDPTRLGALGISAGGYAVLNALHTAPGALAAAWLDGIQVQGLADFPAPTTPGEQFTLFINTLILRLADFHLGRPTPPPFIEILPKLSEPPLVLVAGGMDPFERQVNETYAALAPANIQTWIIDSAWHTGGPAVVEGEYRQRLLAFFSELLGEP